MPEFLSVLPNMNDMSGFNILTIDASTRTDPTKTLHTLQKDLVSYLLF